MRSMTYFVGILAGYMYTRLKEADYKLSLVIKSLTIIFHPQLNAKLVSVQKLNR